jgi:hypothetical protein
MALHNLFTHQRSPLVDVTPNPRGEFVQVWSAPFRAEKRRLLLTYLRTPSGPESICHRIELEDGRFSIVETCGTQRTLYYREGSGPPRRETILPSARILVSDPHNGELIEAIFSRDFDWSASKPKGKPLGDRAVMKLQSTGETWFLATYQRRGEQSALAVVEEYCGHERKKLVEFGHEV